MTYTLELTEADLDEATDAIPETAALIRDAAASLDFVAEGMDAGAFDARDCAGLFRLAARGLRAGEAGEVAALDLVGREMRRVRSQRLEARKHAQERAEAERIVLAQLRADLAAKGVSPAVREACMKVAEKEVSHADQP